MMSEFVLPRFIFCLIQYLREGYNEPGMFNLLFVSTLFKFSTEFSVNNEVNFFRYVFFWLNFFM